MTERSGKSGRALAVELVVVFLGVAIALAADSWRESLGDAAREREYLASLEAELGEARAGLEVGISETDQRLAELDPFLEIVRGRGPIPDSLRTPGVSIFIPVVPTGTLDALVVSGAFRLVSDAELRAALLTERAAVSRWIENSNTLTTTSRAIVSDYLRLQEVITHAQGLPPGALPAHELRSHPEMIGVYLDHRAALLGLKQSMERSLTAIVRLQEIVERRHP